MRAGIINQWRKESAGVGLSREKMHRQELKGMLTINLDRISQISQQGLKVQNLAHLINEKSLKEIHHGMDGKKATGIDKVTKRITTSIWKRTCMRWSVE